MGRSVWAQPAGKHELTAMQPGPVAMFATTIRWLYKPYSTAHRSAASCAQQRSASCW